MIAKVRLSEISEIIKRKEIGKVVWGRQKAYFIKVKKCQENKTSDRLAEDDYLGPE